MLDCIPLFLLSWSHIAASLQYTPFQKKMNLEQSLSGQLGPGMKWSMQKRLPAVSMLENFNDMLRRLGWWMDSCKHYLRSLHHHTQLPLASDQWICQPHQIYPTPCWRFNTDLQMKSKWSWSSNLFKFIQLYRGNLVKSVMCQFWRPNIFLLCS